MEKLEEKKPIMPVIKAMKVGEVQTYPIRRMMTVKSTISMIQAATGRIYKTKQNKPLIVVTRIS